MIITFSSQLSPASTQGHRTGIGLLLPIRNNCPEDQFMAQPAPEPYFQSVAVTIIVLNVVSLLSLCFVIGIYIYNWKKIASFPMRLSFYLCLACLGQNLYVLLLNPITIHQIEQANQEATSGYCTFEGFLKVGFDLSSILWTTLIICSVYASVVRKVNLEPKERTFIVIAYVLPFVLAAIPAILGLYGYVQYFCWFAASEQTTFWLKMGFFFIPLWLFFILNLSLSVRTYLNLKKIQLEPRLLIIFKRLMLFPFIMFVTGLFATVDLVYLQIDGAYVVWLDVVGLVFLSLYGFFNSVAYGFNPLIRDKIELLFAGPSRSSSLNESRMQDQDTSRDTEQIEAELYDFRSARAPTLPNIQPPPHK